MLKIFIYLILFFSIKSFAAANEQYFIGDTIPLSFVRNYGSGPLTGLTVTVTVKNASNGATLLSSTNMTETVSGNGIYTYQWTPSVTVKTDCVITYTAPYLSGTTSFSEYLTINDQNLESRSF